jgi:hypothetical protein
LLDATMRATRMAVHVQTGSLRASAAQDSRWVGDAWEGSISYGGPSRGVINPVNYAQIEAARGTSGGVAHGRTWSGRNSGDHNFMRPTHDSGAERELYIETILEYLRGGA